MRGEDLRERALNRSVEDRYGGGAPEPREGEGDAINQRS